MMHFKSLRCHGVKSDITPYLGLQQPLPMAQGTNSCQAGCARRPRDAQRLVGLPLGDHQDVGEQEQRQLVALAAQLVFGSHLNAVDSAHKAGEHKHKSLSIKSKSKPSMRGDHAGWTILNLRVDVENVNLAFRSPFLLVEMGHHLV